jgi:hypothetical protein
MTMDGLFGVFDGVDRVAQFSDDEAAEEFRREALELDVPEFFRRPAYDDLQVYEVPQGYDVLHRLLLGLRRSRNQDLAVTAALTRLNRERRAADRDA